MSERTDLTIIRLAADRDAWKARAEKAEADNVALLSRMTSAVDVLRDIHVYHDGDEESGAHDPTCEACAMAAALAALAPDETPHPGAALLDRLRAAEKLLSKAAPIAEAIRAEVDFDACDPGDAVLHAGTESMQTVAASAGQAASFMDAYDALKGGGQ